MRSHLTKLSVLTLLLLATPGSGPGPADSRWQCRPTSTRAGKRRHHHPGSGLPQRALDRRERERSVASRGGLSDERQRRLLAGRRQHLEDRHRHRPQGLSRFRRRLRHLRQARGGDPLLHRLRQAGHRELLGARRHPQRHFCPALARRRRHLGGRRAHRHRPAHQARHSLRGQALHRRRQHQQQVRRQPLYRMDGVSPRRIGHAVFALHRRRRDLVRARSTSARITDCRATTTARSKASPARSRADGTLYVVWADGNSIAFTSSRDGGKTFAKSRSVIQTAPLYFDMRDWTAPTAFPNSPSIRVTAARAGCTSPGATIATAISACTVRPPTTAANRGARPCA